MAYSQSILRKAKARLEQARQEQEDAAHGRIRQIYARYPRLREIDIALRGSMAKVVAATFASGGDPRAAVEQVKKENLSLQQEKAAILAAAGLTENDLEASPICADCGGTGYVGERMCKCLKELCRQEQIKELSSLLAGNERFEDFRLEYYPETPDKNYGLSPRAAMEQVYGRCLRYAREFSRNSPSLLFTGSTGLGKTFLSACIARAVADRGCSVVYETAGTMFRDFEDAKFDRLAEDCPDPTQKYLTADLLIIDDLGTEMVTQFTQTALYQVINTRLMEGRPTVISTNLSSLQLAEKYTPQIVSRLLGTYELQVFLGKDIRLLKKR